MAFFKWNTGGGSKPKERLRTKTPLEEHIEIARQAVTFEGKRAPDAESRETLLRAEEDTCTYLERLGFPEAAVRIRGALFGDKVFIFTGFSTKNPFTEEDERIELDGFYSWEHNAIAINESVIERGGQATLYKVAVHELIHKASFLSEERTLHAVEQKGLTQLRRQGGFDISTEVPGVEYSTAAAGGRFGFLNEGFTETVASMIDPSEWNRPHPYHPNRYLIEVLLRALVAGRQAKGERYTLHDAWALLATDYFKNTFTFAKEIEELCGTGTFSKLARITTLEQAEDVVATIAERAGIFYTPGSLKEMQEAPRGGNQLALLKRMEDETARAALSLPPQKMAA